MEEAIVMQIKVKAVFCVLLTSVMMLSACGDDKPKLTGEAATKALDNATSLYFTGNVKDVNVYSDILVDKKNAGYIEETGFWNGRYTVYVNEKEVFHIKIVTDEPINNVKGVTATTYGYYDKNDKCLGYAQERLLDDKEYHFVFLDAKEKLKDYTTDDKVTAIYNSKNKKIGSVTADMDGIFGDDFHIQIDTNSSGKDVEFIDKVAMYVKSESDFSDEHLKNE